ncbi:MAG TPA: DUF1993 domain-containing protein [Steroidobacteraceae bacterium]
MKISMYTMSVESFIHGLTQLSGLLDKAVAYAESKKFDPTVLANSRLAPDMLPLTRQVQIATDVSKGAAARLAGQEPPKFEDNEKTIPELKQRIAKTIDFLKSVPASAFEGAEDRDIRIPLRDHTLEMKGLKYLQLWAVPNFYFHVTTTYAILRHNGVDIGKRDYLGPI